MMSVEQIWPLFGLRVRTPRLELRYPNDAEIAEIAERAAADGVHDPAVMPFTVAWTDIAPPVQQRQFIQYHWGLRSAWQPARWDLNMVVVVDGRVVGSQSVGATEFATVRGATTGSFLTRPEHRKGYGTEMRAAMLHLLFAGLNAEFAETAAFGDNVQSIGVTNKLGYESNGIQRVISRGVAREQLRFRLERSAWQARRRDDISIIGLEPCLDLFGLS